MNEEYYEKFYPENLLRDTVIIKRIEDGDIIYEIHAGLLTNLEMWFSLFVFQKNTPLENLQTDEEKIKNYLEEIKKCEETEDYERANVLLKELKELKESKKLKNKN